MSPSIQFEAQFLTVSLATGVFLMLSYDILRTLRIVFPHGTFLIGMEDFLYWIYAGLITFSLLYGQNDGTLRWFSVAGVFVGMAAYNRFISRFFLKLLKKITIWIKMNLHKVFKRRKKT